MRAQAAHTPASQQATQIEYIRLQIESAKSKARVDERTKLLAAQFKKQSGAK